MISIRRATNEDYILLSELRIEMKEEVNGEVSFDKQSMFYENTLEFYKEMLSGDDFFAFIAEDDGQIVASCGIRTYKVPPTYTNLEGKHGYIANLYTRPEFRNRGIGKELVEKTMEEAINLKCTKLTIHTTESCRGLFNKYKFACTEKYMEMDIK